MGRGRGRVTRADLIWSAGAIFLIFMMHGMGYM